MAETKAYTITSNFVTPLGCLRPDMRVEKTEAGAKQYAMSNWSIAKWYDKGQARYVARFADGVHEVHSVSWDKEEGVETFEIA